MAKSCTVKKGKLGGLSTCMKSSGKAYASSERRAAKQLHEKTEARMRAARRKPKACKR